MPPQLAYSGILRLLPHCNEQTVCKLYTRLGPLQITYAWYAYPCSKAIRVGDLPYDGFVQSVYLIAEGSRCAALTLNIKPGKIKKQVGLGDIVQIKEMAVEMNVHLENVSWSRYTTTFRDNVHGKRMDTHM